MRETIPDLKRRIAARKAQRQSCKDLEARLVWLVAKQIRRELKAEKRT